MMKLVYCLLLGICFLLNVFVHPMKRKNLRRDDRHTKKQALQQKEVYLPPDLIRLIICIHQCYFPWEEIIRIWKLRLVSKCWREAVDNHLLMAQLLGIPLLHYFAGIGDAEEVMLYTLEGYSILEPDHWEFIPAHYAVSNGHLEATKMLFIGGGLRVSPNQKKSIKGFIHKEDILIKELFKNYLDNSSAESDLFEAIESNDREIVFESLLLHGNFATIDHLERADELQQTAKLENSQISDLVCFCLKGKYEEYFFSAIAEGQNLDEVIFNDFKSVGANPNAFNADGAILLHEAAKKNKFLSTLKQLLQCEDINIHLHDKNLHSCNQFGNTPIHNAALQGADQCLEELLKIEGCDVNIIDSGEFGQNPLCDAIDGGNLKCVKILLAHGAKIANINKKNKDTAFHAAVRFKKHEILKELLDAKQCSVDILDGNGLTALQRAVCSDDIESIKILTAAGADTKGLLHCACKLKKKESLSYLLEAKICTPNDKDAQGNTPLHIAADCGDLKILRILLHVGANIHAQNLDGKTAQDLAKSRGHVKIFNCLKKYNFYLENPALSYSTEEDESSLSSTADDSDDF